MLFPVFVEGKAVVGRSSVPHWFGANRYRIPKAQNSACWWSISTTNVRLFCRRQADSLKRSSDKPTLRPALTLGGLLYHLSLVEEDWMEFRFAGLPEREPWASVDWDDDPNWEFRTSTSLNPC